MKSISKHKFFNVDDFKKEGLTFEQSISKMKYKEKITYHIGFLCNECEKEDHHSKETTILSRILLKLSDYGYVYLLQKRISYGLYEYIAIRSSKYQSK